MARRRGNGPTPEYVVMGDRLRAARLARGLSLRGLAERLGVSPSLISQVETGRAKPSVSTLYAIANELGISLDELLFRDAGSATPGHPAGARGVTDEREPGGNGRLGGSETLSPGGVLRPNMDLPADPVQRAADRMSIRLASGVVWDRLTTASVPNIDFLYVTYEVGGASSPEREFQRHAGQEWGFVISGSLGVRIGFEEYILGPGDAIAFDSTTPHRLFNAGDETVHGVWFVLGRRPTEFAAPLPTGRGDRSHEL